jgi:hypothetical protein
VALGRLYDLDELPQRGLAVAHAWARGDLRLTWERLGRTLYREDRARLDVLVGGRWKVGAGVGADRLRLGDTPAGQAVSVDLRLRGRLAGTVTVEAWWPLAAPPAWYGTSGSRRWLRVSGHRDRVVWAVALDGAAGTPAVQGEVMLLLAPMVAVGLRLDPRSGAAGLASGWRAGRLMLRTSHLVHPDLGVWHRWSIGLGGGW